MMRATLNIILLVSLISSGTLLAGETSKVVFAAQWMPQAQFAGYYVAQDRGFYEEAGISVEFRYPTYTKNSLDYLLSGEADVASLFLVNALKAYASGAKPVNIAQFVQQSSILFVSRTESNIARLEDFEGKRAGVFMTGFEEIPKSLLADHGIQVEWMPVLRSVNLFLMGGVDVMTVMYHNEYYHLYLSGINKDELHTFFMSDYGYGVPEDGLYVMEATLHQKRDLLKAFVEATLRGWHYAAENKDYTVDLVVNLMRRANIPSNRTHQRWMLDRTIEAYHLDLEPFEATHLQKEDFDKALNMLLNYGTLQHRIGHQDFHRNILR